MRVQFERRKIARRSQNDGNEAQNCYELHSGKSVDSIMDTVGQIIRFVDHCSLRGAGRRFEISAQQNCLALAPVVFNLNRPARVGSVNRANL